MKALRTRYEPEPSTSTTPCDAAYRWPWLRGPRDRVKDSRALDVARVPLLSSPRAPIVIGALGVRPGEPSRPRAATDRDPRAAALPRRRTAAWGPGCFPLPTVWPVRIDRSMRPYRIGLPSRRSDGRSIAKRLHHRSQWGRRASAFDALAGESERLFHRPSRLALTNEAERKAR